MKRCASCGAEYDDNSKFCSECGGTLEEVSSPPAPEEAAVPILEEPAPIPEQTEAPLTPPWEPTPPPSVFAQPEAEAQPLDAQEPAPEPIPVPTADSRRSGDGVLPRIGFGRALACVLVCVLLFALLAAPLGIYGLRAATGSSGLTELVQTLRVSAIPARELSGEAEPGVSFAQWLSDRLYADLGEEYDFSAGELGEFLDRSTLRSGFAGSAAAVLADYYAGAGQNELSWYEYSGILRENQELFYDIFGLELNADVSVAVARELARCGLPTLPMQETLRSEQPTLAALLRLGCSWAAFGILLALALLVFVWLVKLGRSGLRAFRGLGIVLTVLGALTTLPALLSRLLPGVWRSLFGGAYLLPTLGGAALWHSILVSTGVLALGVLLIVAAHLVRRMLVRRRAHRQEREEKREEKQRRRMEKHGKVPAIYDD